MPTLLPALIRLMSFKPFRGKTKGEDDLAIEVASYLRAATLEGMLKATWTCIPHEVGAMSLNSKGFKTAQTRYAKAKAMGLITGSADYVFVWPQGGGWIELKAQTGSLSTSQRDFRLWCEATGTRHATCRSLEQVVETLFRWGVLTTAK